MIDANANVNVKINQYMPLLCLAVGRDNIDIVKMLVNADVDINETYSNKPTTALYRALTNGNEEMVEFLLKAGADPNAGSPLPIEGATGAIRKLLIKAGFTNFSTKFNK